MSKIVAVIIACTISPVCHVCWGKGWLCWSRRLMYIDIIKGVTSWLCNGWWCYRGSCCGTLDDRISKTSFHLMSELSSAITYWTIIRNFKKKLQWWLNWSKHLCVISMRDGWNQCLWDVPWSSTSHHQNISWTGTGYGWGKIGQWWSSFLQQQILIWLMLCFLE